MKQEDKQLALQDLCARLPYVVIGEYSWKGNEPYNRELTGSLFDELKSSWDSTEDSEFSPYLRPLSSMTEEEKRELQSFFPGSFGGQWLNLENWYIDIYECETTMTQEKFKQASKIQEEIGRLNLLIKYIENKDEKDFTDTMELAFNMSSDFLYLVHLLGKDDVLGLMRTKKRMLEKEFEEL